MRIKLQDDDFNPDIEIDRQARLWEMGSRPALVVLCFLLVATPGLFVKTAYPFLVAGPQVFGLIFLSFIIGVFHAYYKAEMLATQLPRSSALAALIYAIGVSYFAAGVLMIYASRSGFPVSGLTIYTLLTVSVLTSILGRIAISIIAKLLEKGVAPAPFILTGILSGGLYSAFVMPVMFTGYEVFLISVLFTLMGFSKSLRKNVFYLPVALAIIYTSYTIHIKVDIGMSGLYSSTARSVIGDLGGEVRVQSINGVSIPSPGGAIEKLIISHIDPGERGEKLPALVIGGAPESLFEFVNSKYKAWNITTDPLASGLLSGTHESTVAMFKVVPNLLSELISSDRDYALIVDSNIASLPEGADGKKGGGYYREIYARLAPGGTLIAVLPADDFYRNATRKLVASIDSVFTDCLVLKGSQGATLQALLCAKPSQGSR